MLDAPIGTFLPSDERITLYHPIRRFDLIEKMIVEDRDIDDSYSDIVGHINMCAVKYDKPTYIYDIHMISMAMIFQYKAQKCLCMMITQIPESIDQFWECLTADPSEACLFRVIEQQGYHLDSDWVLRHPNDIRTILLWIDINRIDNHLHVLAKHKDILIEVYGISALTKHAIVSPSQMIEDIISEVENINDVIYRCIKDTEIFLIALENIRCGMFSSSYIYQILMHNPEIQYYL